jgi:stage V sporulation protein R
VYGFNESATPGRSWQGLQGHQGESLHQLTNFGQPIIEVVDGNYENRAELLLAHRHDGTDLKLDYARDTLRNLASMWKRPANLITKVDGKGVILRFDGKDHSEKRVDL